MRSIFAAGVISVGTLVAAGPANAGACDGTVTITATVLRAFANSGGKTTLDVKSAKPCSVQWIEIGSSKPPASCKFGASVKATGKVDDLLGQILMAGSYQCR